MKSRVCPKLWAESQRFYLRLQSFWIGSIPGIVILLWLIFEFKKIFEEETLKCRNSNMKMCLHRNSTFTYFHFFARKPKFWQQKLFSENDPRRILREIWKKNGEINYMSV